MGQKSAILLTFFVNVVVVGDVVSVVANVIGAVGVNDMVMICAAVVFDFECPDSVTGRAMIAHTRAPFKTFNK